MVEAVYKRRVRSSLFSIDHGGDLTGGETGGGTHAVVGHGGSSAG